MFWNPYHVIRKHQERGKVGEAKWQALVFRASEIGADDLDEDIPPVVPTKLKAKVKALSAKSGS